MFARVCLARGPQVLTPNHPFCCFLHTPRFQPWPVRCHRPYIHLHCLIWLAFWLCLLGHPLSETFCSHEFVKSPLGAVALSISCAGPGSFGSKSQSDGMRHDWLDQGFGCLFQGATFMEFGNLWINGHQSRCGCQEPVAMVIRQASWFGSWPHSMLEWEEGAWANKLNSEGPSQPRKSW